MYIPRKKVKEKVDYICKVIPEVVRMVDAPLPEWEKNKKCKGCKWEMARCPMRRIHE